MLFYRTHQISIELNDGVILEATKDVYGVVNRSMLFLVTDIHLMNNVLSFWKIIIIWYIFVLK